MTQNHFSKTRFFEVFTHFFLKKVQAIFPSYNYNPTTSEKLCRRRNMDAVQRGMLQALTYTNEPVYAIDPDILLCTEELQPKQVTWSIEEMHKQACRSIISIAVLMQSKSMLPHLQTYINVYELWHACMRAVFDEANQQPHHPKHKFAKYIKDIPFQKLVVILPAVCFWVSVKCCDTFSVTTKDVANNIVALHVDRGDRHVHYTLQDLRDAEDALLQLLDFDIYKQQDKIDQMEEYIRAQYGDAYDSSESQRQICEIIYATYLRRPITI